MSVLGFGTFYCEMLKIFFRIPYFFDHLSDNCLKLLKILEDT